MAACSRVRVPACLAPLAAVSCPASLAMGISCTLSRQALEARWGGLNASIEELRAERGEVVAATVEAERAVLVWERRVQLEKEMQVGGGVGGGGRGRCVCVSASGAGMLSCEAVRL
jgi:hypothetical protein